VTLLLLGQRPYRLSADEGDAWIRERPPADRLRRRTPSRWRWFDAVDPLLGHWCSAPAPIAGNPVDRCRRAGLARIGLSGRLAGRPVEPEIERGRWPTDVAVSTPVAGLDDASASPG